MSWKDIFALDMFKSKEKDDNDINKSMSMAQKSSKNKLEMSTKMNDFYFADKKVIQQIELVNGSEDK